MYPEDELVMISALEHYSYCPRQCGLIHLERIFDENVFTLRGRAVHERAHESTTRSEEGARVERGLPLWSDRLGLTGVADVVEFHLGGAVYPVEYKHGRGGGKGVPKHAALQLCAQALCLEEMLHVSIPMGALYLHTTRRRVPVPLDADLREATERTIAQVRAMLRGGALPPPVNDARCPQCSLIDACIPTAGAEAARRAARAMWRLEDADDDP